MRASTRPCSRCCLHLRWPHIIEKMGPIGPLNQQRVYDQMINSWRPATTNHFLINLWGKMRPFRIITLAGITVK